MGTSHLLLDPPVKVFTRSKLFYHSAHVDDSRGHLFVGAMEKLFQLPLDDISSPNSKELDLMAPSDNVNKCGVYRGQHRAADLTLVPAASQVPVLGINTSNEAQGRCPNYLHQSSRTLWLDDAPTSGSSCVVALTVLPTDQYGFFRLTPSGFLLRSTDTRGVQKPHVVDAFSTAEHAYFVFREEGIERKACGARNVSTLARLCKNEVGVSTRSADPWSTLMKTRLQCDDITAANFIFNEIYASHWVPDLENGVLFGAFVTVTEGRRTEAGGRKHLRGRSPSSCAFGGHVQGHCGAHAEAAGLRAGRQPQRGEIAEGGCVCPIRTYFC
ncbi:semaphorin-2A-like isoform X2 [Dermacentor andersoni]|uniref:semaphorin-2A-like isoform X2 n=1 Tax=Dermacentor andersoni TaxID=34620 RepID=UPI002416CDFC|nr:semaphorin-2A-like isoform X2 [Dermacentor andersoni]